MTLRQHHYRGIMPIQTLTIAGVCFLDATSRLLTVRKHGTSKFQLPGGKLDAGESPLAAALREVAEEILVELRPEDLTLLGSWSAPAANEEDTVIDATIFVSNLIVAPVASAEIDELQWVDLSDDPASSEHFAPLLRTHVFGALSARV